MPALLRCFPGIFLFSPKNFKMKGQPRRFRQDWPLFIPSINKGRHGFVGQKCPHTASSPLAIRQYSLRGFPCLGVFLLRQNCKAPASDEFTSDFWLLRRRRADARQGEKGKKRRKGTLAGVSAFVNRW